jgi:hypothetical protein
LSAPDTVASKKRRKVSTHHHYIHHSQRASPDSATVNAEVIQLLLERAIGLTLTAVGYNGVDSDALQFFRVHVEECTC